MKYCICYIYWQKAINNKNSGPKKSKKDLKNTLEVYYVYKKIGVMIFQID